MSLLDAAYKLVKAGVSVVGCLDGRPMARSWKEFQERVPTEGELVHQFESRGSNMLAIVCGKVSGNIEVIDVDLKYDDTGKLWDELMDLLLEYFNGVLPLPLVSTRNGGYHIYYRCEVIEGNKKLASVKNDQGNMVTVIETRGEGGLIFAPPSPNYELKNGYSLTNVPTIQPHERAAIIDICKSFNEKYEVEKQKTVSNDTNRSNYKSTPWDEYDNDAADPWRQLLIDKGWEMTKESSTREYWKRPGTEALSSANWHKEKRVFYVFSNNTPFESEKGYRPSAIHAILAHGGNFSTSAAALIQAGYGSLYESWEKDIKRERDKMKKNGATSMEVDQETQKLLQGMVEGIDVKQLRKEGGLTQSEMAELLGVDRTYLSKIENNQRQLSSGMVMKMRSSEKVNGHLPPVKEYDQAIDEADISTHIKFYFIKKGNFVLDRNGLLKLLKELNYFILKEDFTSLSGRVVKVDDDTRTIKEVDRSFMKRDLYSYVKTEIDLPDFDKSQLLNLVLSIPDAYWNSLIEFMEHKTYDQIEILRDTKNEAFIPFINGVVVITKSDIQLKQYSELPPDTYIWQGAIIDKDINLLAVDKEADRNSCNYYRFLKRISGITERDEHLEGAAIENRTAAQRFEAIITSLGYLMHTYRDPSRPFGIFIGENTIDHGKGGGTGKGLINQGLKKVRNLHAEGAKQFNIRDPFKYQNVPLSCEILALEDLPPWFKLELLYNEFTESMKIGEKFKKPIVIPYARLPKFVMTSNYDLENSGETHFERRIKKLTIENYFNKKRTPETEFGEQFFREEWDRDPLRWTTFYNNMFWIIRQYLIKGILEIEDTEKLKAKAIIAKYKEFGRDLFDFLVDYFDTYKTMREWVTLRSIYDDFITYSEINTKEFHINKFKAAVNDYAKKFGITMDRRKTAEGVNEYHFAYDEDELEGADVELDTEKEILPF